MNVRTTKEGLIEKLWSNEFSFFVITSGYERCPWKFLWKLFKEKSFSFSAFFDKKIPFERLWLITLMPSWKQLCKGLVVRVLLPMLEKDLEKGLSLSSRVSLLFLWRTTKMLGNITETEVDSTALIFFSKNVKSKQHGDSIFPLNYLLQF
jgi:hypothetical protein